MLILIKSRKTVTAYCGFNYSKLAIMSSVMNLSISSSSCWESFLSLTIFVNWNAAKCISSIVKLFSLYARTTSEVVYAWLKCEYISNYVRVALDSESDSPSDKNSCSLNAKG